MSIKIKVALICLLLIGSCALPLTLAKANNPTLIVPDNYPTIQEAINAAANGDTIYIRKGSYEGPVNETLTINKIISLIGENKENTTFHLNPPLVEKNIFTYFYMGYADPISISANDVKIAGLTIESLGGNIAVNANRTIIASNNLHAGIVITGDQSQIADNTIDGYAVSLVGGNTTIARNIIMGRIETTGNFNLIADNFVNGTSGESIIDLRSNDSVVLRNTVVSPNNFTAIQVEYLGHKNLIAKNNIVSGGLELTAYTSNNTVCGNTLNGWGVALMGFSNTFYANQLSHIGIGGTHGGTVDAAYNSFYHNNFAGNSPEFQVYTKQPGPLRWDNGVEGNYWSSYTGDGATPYEVYAEYHYFDGAIREDTNVNLGQDTHPLLAPYDTQNLQVQLPAWAEQALQNTLQIPLNPQSPPPQTNPEQPPIPTTTAILIGGMLVFAGAISLLSYYKQRKKMREDRNILSNPRQK